MNIGEEFKTNNYGLVRVIESPAKGKCKVKFLDTKNEQYVYVHLLRRGSVKDSKKPVIFGLGISGDRNTRKNKKAYKCWFHMLERCYDHKYHSYDSYGGDGIKVCNEWLYFTNFLKWFESQPNSSLIGMEIDKDLKKGMIYSPENCLMIPKSINTASIKKRSKSSNLSVGVSNRFGIFQAGMSQRGRTIHIGSFPTEKEASEAYKKEKKSFLMELAEIELLNGLISIDTFKLINNYEV